MLLPCNTCLLTTVRERQIVTDSIQPRLQYIKSFTVKQLWREKYEHKLQKNVRVW